MNSTIPKDWCHITLKEICIDNQQGFASGKRDNNGVKQLRMNNVTNDGRFVLDTYIKVPAPSNIGKYDLKKGDILFNNTNSADLVGKTAVVNNEAVDFTFSNHFNRIRVDTNTVLPEWIRYLFEIKWQQGYFKQICRRYVHQAGIGKSEIEAIPISFPSLLEQNRVVEIISSVEKAILRSDELISKTEKLKKGLMQKFFENMKWRSEALSNEKIFKLIMGQSPPSNTYNFNKEGLPFYQGNADFGRMYPNPRIYCDSPLKIADEGDILISIRAPVGELNITDKKCCIGRGLAAIRIIAGDNLFYYYYLNYIKNRLQAFSQGSTFKAITATEFKKINVPIPDIKEQQKIVEIFWTVDNKLDLERKRKEKMMTIKKGLMNDLLTGKKRVRGFKNA